MKDVKTKSLIMIAGVVLVVFIILMIIISSISGKRLSFEKVEEKMKNAAIKYYQTYEESLPRQSGDYVIITAEELKTAKKMKALNKIVPKGANCSGQVIVTKNGEKYLYSPMLECGVEYSTKKLSDFIVSNSDVVTRGAGLYSNGNGYVFKGAQVNNIVKINEMLWAIIEIDSEGYMRLINVSSGKKGRSVWDDSYNIKENARTGINDYYTLDRESKIRDLLISYEQENYYLKDEDKAYVIPKKWCIGKRAETNVAIDNSEECSLLSEEQMFGLPYVSDAFIASTDPDCHTINDASCDNYNYMSEYGLSSWTMTGVAGTTNSAYFVVSASYIPTKTSSNKSVMPSIYLSNNVIYGSGDGTYESPYILK